MKKSLLRSLTLVLVVIMAVSSVQTISAAAGVLSPEAINSDVVAASTEATSDDNTEFIKTANSLAGTVQAYFENSNWYKYIEDNRYTIPRPIRFQMLKERTSTRTAR